MSEDFTTLWQVTESWPCDYAAVTRDRDDAKAPVTVSLHLDGCRKCTMRKKLIVIDELMKRVEGYTLAEFRAAALAGGATAESIAETSEEYIAGTREHAGYVRDLFIGVPE